MPLTQQRPPQGRLVTEQSADPVRFPWPDNMPLVDQVKALGAVLMEHYPHAFDRSEGAMEKAARLLLECAADTDTHNHAAHIDGGGADG